MLNHKKAMVTGFLGGLALLSTSWFFAFRKKIDLSRPNFLFVEKSKFFIDPMYAYDEAEDVHFFFSAFRDRSSPASASNPYRIGFVEVDGKSKRAANQIAEVIRPKPSEFRFWRSTERSEHAWYGTGSIIKKDGFWYMFLANSRVGLARSIDLRSWEKISDFIWTGEDIVPEADLEPAIRFVDPYVYFDENRKEYVMIYIAQHKSTKVRTLAYNTSKDLLTWVSGPELKIPPLFDHDSDPEVPQLVLKDGHYHLFISYFKLPESGYRLLRDVLMKGITALSRGELVLSSENLDEPFLISPCSRYLGNDTLRYASRHFTYQGSHYMTSMINGSDYDARALPVPIRYEFDAAGCVRFLDYGAFETNHRKTLDGANLP